MIIHFHHTLSKSYNLDRIIYSAFFEILHDYLIGAMLCIAACYVVISILKMTCATFKTPRLFEYLSRVCSYLLKCACYATKSFKMCSYSCGCSCFNHILLNQQTLAIGITPLIFLALLSLVCQGQSTLGKMDFVNIRCQLFTTIKQNRLIQDFKLSNQTYLLQKNVQDT